MFKYSDAIMVIIMIFFFVLVGWTLVYTNKERNEECIQKGGQIVRHNIKYGDSCILPPGKR